MIKLNPDLPIDEVVDTAVNQTLGRSVNTTLTTTLPLIAIFLFGGVTLKNFSLALIIGFILGAYSSIFIASSLLGWWRSRTESLNESLSASTVSLDPSTGEPFDASLDTANASELEDEAV